MAKAKKSAGKKGRKVPTKKAATPKGKEKEVERDESEDEQIDEQEHQVDNGQDEDDAGFSSGDDEEANNEAPPVKKAKTAIPAKKGKPGPASSKAKMPAVGKGKGKAKKTAPLKKTVEPKESDHAESSEDDAEYEVESILDLKTHRDGTRDFLVKWVGYPKNEASWEPESNLDCQDKKNAFLSKLGKIKDASAKNLRTDRKQTKPYQDSNRNSGVRSSRRFSAQPRMTYHGLDE